MLSRLAAVLVVGLALIALACSSGGSEPGTGDGPAAGEDLTRTSETDGITVEARWLTEAELTDLDADLSQYPLDAFVLLELKLDAHSGDLNEIDLQDGAMLRQGQAEEPPEAWMSESDDSHHREGILVFPRQLETGPVQLVLRIGEEEVVLLWEAAPAA